MRSAMRFQSLSASAKRTQRQHRGAFSRNRPDGVTLLLFWLLLAVGKNIHRHSPFKESLRARRRRSARRFRLAMKETF